MTLLTYYDNILQNRNFIMNTILKIEKDNEKKEMLFELKYQISLTIGQRFKMMLKKSEEMRKLLEKSGHRKDAQVIKRTEGSGRPQ